MEQQVIHTSSHVQGTHPTSNFDGFAYLVYDNTSAFLRCVTVTFSVNTTEIKTAIVVIHEGFYILNFNISISKPNCIVTKIVRALNTKVVRALNAKMVRALNAIKVIKQE